MGKIEHYIIRKNIKHIYIRTYKLVLYYYDYTIDQHTFISMIAVAHRALSSYSLNPSKTSVKCVSI